MLYTVFGCRFIRVGRAFVQTVNCPGLDQSSELKVHKLYKHEHFYTAALADILRKFCRNNYPGKAKRAECVSTRHTCLVEPTTTRTEA